MKQVLQRFSSILQGEIGPSVSQIMVIAGFSLVALNLLTYYTCLIESYLFENGHSYSCKSKDFHAHVRSKVKV